MMTWSTLTPLESASFKSTESDLDGFHDCASFTSPPLISQMMTYFAYPVLGLPAMLAHAFHQLHCFNLTFLANISSLSQLLATGLLFVLTVCWDTLLIILAPAQPAAALPQQCPADLFTETLIPCHQFKNIHVWGCPGYVLDPTLQQGKKLPCWEPRSCQDVFVGYSPVHSSDVTLVHNLQSGSILPQYHVVFDDLFTTIQLLSVSEETNCTWQTRAIYTYELHGKVKS